jgi:anti-sigma factor RsiW
VATDRDGEQLNQSEDAPHDAVGAYVLDALPVEERAAFVAHLRTCESCQREVAQLTPVVGLLPRLLELGVYDDEETEATAFAPPVPSSNLRDRILEAARAEGRPAAEPAAAPEIVAEPEPVPVVPERPERPERIESPSAPEEPIAFPPVRARGRIRGGVPGDAAKAPTTPWETLGRINAGWLAAAVMAIVAVGAIIWALALQGTIDDKDREIAALRQRSTALAWHLAPGGTDPASQSGTFLFSLPDQAGALVVRNMPQLAPDKVYQSWLIKGSDAPEPGPTFTVDPSGTGSVPIVDSGATGYNTMAVTEEPAGGSAAPTSDILLVGQLSGAAGALPGLNVAAIQLTPPDGNHP